MVAYEAVITVDDPSQLTLRNLPVKPGQQVRVKLEIEDDTREQRVEALRELFRKTQAAAPDITEEEIEAEIAAARRERRCAS